MLGWRTTVQPYEGIGRMACLYTPNEQTEKESADANANANAIQVIQSPTFY